jgi:hypothetical protein
MLIQRCLKALLVLLVFIPSGIASDYKLPDTMPRSFTGLVASAENIVLARLREFTTTPETVSLLLDPIEALKGEIPTGFGNLVVPARIRTPIGGHGTQPVSWTVLVFLARNGQNSNTILPPVGHHPQVPWDLVLPVPMETEHVVAKDWCESSLFRRVICLGSLPLLRSETAGLGMAFLGLTRADSGSSDLRFLWRALRERGGTGAGYGLAQALWSSDEEAACHVQQVFAKASRSEQSSIRMAVDSAFSPVTRRPLRCLGDLALDETAPKELRIAAAMAIQRMHVPAAADQLVRLVESKDDQLRDIGTFGLALLAAGKPPVGIDVSGLPTRTWKLELPESLTETEQAMRRDTPAFKVDSQTRGSFWVDWYHRHKDLIETQVIEVEALQ